MSVGLLLEYISLVTERIRSNKDRDGKKFDLRTFKTMPDHKEALRYALEYLDVLGQGSSRAAFLLNSRHVLKIALNDKGTAQNEAEVSVYTNPESQAVVARIYSADPQYGWIVSDVVKPLNNVKEFEQLSGVDWRTFCDYVNGNVKQRTMPKDAPEFVKAIVNTANKNNLLRGDLAQQNWNRDPSKDVLDHYGKTPDGRLVLLDYGYTEGVHSSHYSSRPTGSQKKDVSTSNKTVRPGEKSGERDQKTGAAAPNAKRAAADQDEKTNAEPAARRRA